ncbi:peptidase, S9A/B/C family, catalytic domain protein [Ancylostoma ceylanicum]|uniref:Prolyl endopeptidase n=1 Tax=Ancylostoma ceylanicum TaxID=53326 RepID=A0A0D6M345_9BILA|nr:peptidase, S9A/B/C family, catalytic domain protein [Ancylostoma ceylanicum]
MEDPDAAETRKFVDDLNAISAPFIAGAPSREKIREKISAWTKDGSIYAYGLSEKGSDWVTVKFRGADKKDLSDVITGVKHSSLSWLKDNSGIFYCKYPDHRTATEGTSVEKHKYHSLYFHRMGTNCKEDVLVHDRRDNADYMIGGSVTEDGKYLIIDVSRGCDPYNMLYYYDLSAAKGGFGKIKPTPLFDKLDAKYDYVDHDDESMLIQTNKDAPMFKLIRVSLKDGSVKELVPENPRHKLNWATVVAGNRLVLSYIEDVKDALYVYDLNTGARQYQFPLKIGSLSGFFGKKALSEMLFSFESFTVPTIIYRVDFASVNKRAIPEVEELRRVRIKGMDEKQFNVEQVFFASKDGTKVPMYIISLKDTPRDGNNATILNGYGGFNVADMPYFSISRLLVVRHFKGIIACANLRGGSEYGENWHMSGMRDKKQNVFDDFISAAEYLIENKYTCSKNVMDMLRFHRFTVGGAWVPEYGNPDVPNDFEFIYKLVLLAFLAKLHKLQTNPLLVRVEVKAGHGAGKPTTKVIAEIVDMYSFLQRVLDLEWTD